MTRADEFLSNVITWATRDACVRRLLLVGSRARTTPLDDLADFDLQVYVETNERYTQDQDWLSAIGRIWVCVPDEYSDGDIQVPTRLVIFDGGMKVDFAFYPVGHVSTGVSAGLPYRILLDKDLAGGPHGTTSVQWKQRPVPNELAFRRLVEEFWFEAYHVAKYLARKELWLAKSRDWATKRFLLTMIDWHEQIARGRVHEVNCVGQRSCVSPDTWEALYRTFGAFEREESWRAALATMSLFRRLAAEVAATARFTYPTDVDRNISEFILRLRDAGQDAQT